MSYSRTLTMYVDKELTPEAAARRFATFAKDYIAGQIASGRVPASYRRLVDGVEGAREDAVQAGGTILYRFGGVGEVTVFALAFLRERSPSSVVTGGGRLYRQSFRDSFYVAINGRFIRAAALNPKHVPPDAEIVIGNTQPYSRLVDVQMAGNRRLRFSVEPGLFSDATEAIDKRYGKLVTTKRVYTMEFPGQYRLRYAQHQKGQMAPRRHEGSRVESPAIVIRPR